MDIWRYSDWWGLGAKMRNSQKHIWHWRDWIVESLNADKGYDQMLREMLAADELYPNDLDRLRATGFLVRHYFIFNHTTWMDETIEHTSKAFLGLTLNCAKCHDHKYDPIAQQTTVEFINVDPTEPHTVTSGTSDSQSNDMTPLHVITGSDGALTSVVNTTSDFGNATDTTGVNSGFLQSAPEDAVARPVAAPGTTRFRVTFNTIGTFYYHCALHDVDGMQGKVVVAK